MNTGEVVALLGFVLAGAAAAIPGAVFRPGEWYQELMKPPWCPPNWLFGPVWLVLYISIAISGWLVWREAGIEGAATALLVYALQLVLNGLWSAIFFGLRRPDLALIELVCLWVSIAITIILFYPVDQIAAFILVPYAAWVSFAVALNYSVWRLNLPGS